jgi:hypothetical protein
MERGRGSCAGPRIAPEDRASAPAVRARPPRWPMPSRRATPAAEARSRTRRGRRRLRTRHRSGGAAAHGAKRPAASTGTSVSSRASSTVVNEGTFMRAGARLHPAQHPKKGPCARGIPNRELRRLRDLSGWRFRRRLPPSRVAPGGPRSSPGAPLPHHPLGAPRTLATSKAPPSDPTPRPALAHVPPGRPLRPPRAGARVTSPRWCSPGHSSSGSSRERAKRPRRTRR